MKTTKIDLYAYDKKLKGSIERVKKSNVSQINKKAILEFIDDCFARGLSKPRVIFYLDRLLITAKLLKKDFIKAKREDIKKLVRRINDKEYSERTKKDFRVAIKRFYQWLKGIEEKGVYPDEVRWIPTTLKHDNHILPEELLTEEEVNKLISTAEHPRDKALVAALADSGCRIGELLTLRLKHLVFDKYSAILTVNGKTGMRRIRVIGATPYLASWKSVHPDKDDPEAPLWVVRGTSKDIARNKIKKKYKLNWSYALGYRAATKLLQNLASRCGIKKRVNPHSFRHARATYLANKLTEAQLKELFGWTQASKMAAIYVHMSGRDTDKALLKVYGLGEHEEKEESKLKPRKCPRCSKENPATARICEACGAVLDLKEALRLDVGEKNFMSMLMKMAEQQKEMAKTLQKISGKKFDIVLPLNKEKVKTR